MLFTISILCNVLSSLSRSPLPRLDPPWGPLCTHCSRDRRRCSSCSRRSLLSRQRRSKSKNRRTRSTGCYVSSRRSSLLGHRCLRHRRRLGFCGMEASSVQEGAVAVTTCDCSKTLGLPNAHTAKNAFPEANTLRGAPRHFEESTAVVHVFLPDIDSSVFAGGGGAFVTSKI